MFLTALCPTFRRPELLANSVCLWERQWLPSGDRAELIILDDGGTFADQRGPGWKLISVPHRYASLPEKFNALAGLASPASDAFLVWEDDDTYLPGYVAAHAHALRRAELSKPAFVLSDYPGRLISERTDGRFHSTLGFRRELFARVGGWPATKRADFDQQFIQRLQTAARSTADPFSYGPVSSSPFVYRWHTGMAHGQSTMRSGDDETWYDRAAHLLPETATGQVLLPRLDAATRQIFSTTGRTFGDDGACGGSCGAAAGCAPRMRFPWQK